MTNAVLLEAKITGADFRGAIVDGIDFRNLSLKGVFFDVAQAIAVVQSYGAKIS